MVRKWLIVGCALGAFACSDATDKTPNDWELSETQDEQTDDTDTNDDETSDDETDDETSDDDETVTDDDTITDDDETDDDDEDNCLPSVPDAHREAGAMCDDDRAPGVSPPDDPFAPADCQTDDDCTDGPNGRCTGNSHDGWYCTYDQCFDDSGCGGGSVCECEGGFRSDHNVCLPGNCVTDADCGETGFCSPSFGECGNYSGVVGYFCHTCEDECVNDSDCGGSVDGWGAYCMYDRGVGHWRCSDSHCAG